jgi:prolyl-tRNA editing enzyme YbaK/EbsC (Cys-tRNA(Pro) deacylase)
MMPVVAAALNAIGATFEERPCDPELADTAAFCEHYGVPMEDSANTILIAAKRPAGLVAACLVLATHRLDVNGVVRNSMGAKKVSFAKPELTAELTGMVMGGVTPFGLPDDMSVLVDGAVMERDTIIVGAGSRDAKLWLKPGELSKLENVSVIEGLASPFA